MKNACSFLILLLLLISHHSSWAQQASKTGQHLIKFSFGTHWNPLVENDIGYEKSLTTVFIQKGTPRLALGTKLGLEWEWMFSGKWSLQTGALFEAKTIKFDNYERNNFHGWGGPIIVIDEEEEQAPNFDPRIYAHEMGNVETKNLAINIPFLIRHYLTKQGRLFIETGIRLQKIIEENRTRTFTQTTYFKHENLVSATEGLLGTILVPANPPIVSEETRNTIFAPSPFQFAILGGLGTTFSLSSQFRLEAKLQYQYFSKTQYYFYYWDQRHQLGFTLGIAFAT